MIFERLGRLINRAAWVIVGVAIAFAAIGGIFGGPVGKSLQVGGFQDPNSQSTVAVARLQSASGVRSDGGLVALVQTPDGATSPAGQAEATKVAQVIGADPSIAQVVTFYETHDPSMVASDGSSTIVVGFWKPITDQQAGDGATRLEAALKGDSNVELGAAPAVYTHLHIPLPADPARPPLLPFPIPFFPS